MFFIILCVLFGLFLSVLFTYCTDRLRARAYFKEFERANRKSKRQSSFGA